MLITRTITKKLLENIVHETFTNFGNLTSSSLLDSLKYLGFYYATNAGISINIEDLKTPDVKKAYLKTAKDEMKFISDQWEQGFVSDTERFQTIIDSWNVATESLKNRIVNYYQIFDPANNLYIMAFSGARGNMSQVRQLVGMRGLMSDQEGKIIDLPIQTNFREGLSSIDYIISSYGARKGIVDTALKTADSGYLTRRLIYIGQDLVVREMDCKTKSGVSMLVTKDTTIKNIVGRILISARDCKGKINDLNYKTGNEEAVLDEITLKKLKNYSNNTQGPIKLNIRSPLTCNSNGSVCQKCYGWDLSKKNLVSLGEAVGIIAAQSIGEPGTQLTMRTFHTGGIFTSEMLQQTVAPFSGHLEVPNSLKTVPYRTTHGILVSKLQQEAYLKLVDWRGEVKNIFLEIGSFFYLTNSTFIRKNQLISEHPTRSSVPGARRLKPVYTPNMGEIRFESLLVRYISREEKPKVKVNQDDGRLWLAEGRVIPLPKEVKKLFSNDFSKTKSFACLKLVSPESGIITIENNNIYIQNKNKKVKFDISSLNKKFENCEAHLSIMVKNYQYVDNFTVIGVINFFFNYDGKIYGIRKKPSLHTETFLFITEKDIWKINSEQVNNLSFFSKNKSIVRKGSLLNQNLQFSKSGFFLSRDGFKMIFQNATPIFLSRGTILNYKQGDFTFDKNILATLVNYTQQTEDIVQGLPKIEELIEARVPSNKAYLSSRPGIFLSSSFLQNLYSSKINKNITFYSYDRTISNLNDTKENENNEENIENEKIDVHDQKISTLKKPKQIVNIIHSVFLKEDKVFFDDKTWCATPIPPEFFPFKKKTKFEFYFMNKNKKILRINGRNINIGWTPNLKEIAKKDSFLYKFKDNKFVKWKKLKNDAWTFINTKVNHQIIQTENDDYFLLECLDPISEYKLPLTSQILWKSGNFIDIAEPITEGIIDPHEVLSILFKYHSVLDGTIFGTIKSLTKFQLLLVNSIQSIYQSQGVDISSKHIEIIVRQMTARVVIKESGDTPFLPGELIRLSLILEISRSLKQISLKGLTKLKSPQKSFKCPQYEPICLSTTNSSLSKDGFLSAAGFQETKRVLTKAAIEGNSDWFRGLKECVIIGRLIPAGSAFLNYKNYLDHIYLYKDNFRETKN